MLTKRKVFIEKFNYIFLINMNKKILLISLLTLIIIFSGNFVMSQMVNDYNKDTQIKETKVNIYKDIYNLRECSRICSWCYFTDYSCDLMGICC